METLSRVPHGAGPKPALKTRRLREIRRHALIYAGLAPFVVIAVFPVLWMAITAFKEDADLYRTDHVPFWFYLPPTLEHFRTLLIARTGGSSALSRAQPFQNGHLR